MSGRWDSNMKTAPSVWAAYAFLIIMLVIVFIAGFMYGAYAEEVIEFGDSISITVSSATGWVYWIYESFEPFYWNAYGTQLSYQQIYIVANAPKNFDYMSGDEKLYIYDYECRHHQEYKQLDDDYYKYRIYGECDRYASWYSDYKENR